MNPAKQVELRRIVQYNNAVERDSLWGSPKKGKEGILCFVISAAEKFRTT